MKINNLPNTLKEYIVFRIVDGESWFWGTWDEYEKALEASREIEGFVIDKGAVERVG